MGFQAPVGCIGSGSEGFYEKAALPVSLRSIHIEGVLKTETALVTGVLFAGIRTMVLGAGCYTNTRYSSAGFIMCEGRYFANVRVFYVLYLSRWAQWGAQYYFLYRLFYQFVCFP